MSLALLVPLVKVPQVFRPSGSIHQSISLAKSICRLNKEPQSRFTSQSFASSSRQCFGKHQLTAASAPATASATEATTAAAAQAFAKAGRFACKTAYARRRAENSRLPSRIRVTRVKQSNQTKEVPLPIQAAVTKEVVKSFWFGAPPRLTQNAMVLRFSNENSYLNWARNGVLSSAVGVAMYAQEHHRGAQLSGAGLLLLGFGFLGVGTVKYIFYILRFRQMMELSWGSVIGTCSHASVALLIWLTATASFLESVPLELDAFLLTEPIASYLPFRIRQGLIETYSLYLDDLEHQNDEEERVMRAIRGEKEYDPEPDLS